MRSMHRQWAALAIVSAIGLSLLLASSATARIPRFSPPTIVPGTSIGGVKVGMTKAQAVAVWGRPDRSQPDGSATWFMYTAIKTLDSGQVIPYPQPFAGFYVRARRVVAVSIETAENAAADAKLRRVRTSRGIRLESTMAAARRAYGFSVRGQGEAGLSRGLFRQQRRCTLFYAPDSPYQVIEAIVVGLCSADAGLLRGV